VARYSTHIDKHCASCGPVENDAHLFFLCDLPKQVWASSSTPWSPHLINPTQDGVQLILPDLLTSNPNE
jgi:hypothetical protein